MNFDHVVEALLGLMTIAVTYAALRGGRQANKAQADAAAKAVDAEAYSRAQKIYEGAIGQLNEEVTGLRTEISRLHGANDTLTAEVSKLRASNRELAREVEHLRNGH